MLGRLLNRAAGPASGDSCLATSTHLKPIQHGLDSVQEDEHTRSLLFPDLQDLYDHRLRHVFPLSSGPALSLPCVFDYDVEMELEPRHVRIIIMQDALGSVAPSVLFDSQTPPLPPPSHPERRSAAAGSQERPSQNDRRPSTSPRKAGLAAPRLAMAAPESPLFGDSGCDGSSDRRASLHSRPQANADLEFQRQWRDYREELSELCRSAFGNSELMAYKGPSTKIHTIPRRTCDISLSIGDGRGSLGRSSMRSRKLAQSFSLERARPHSPASTATWASSRKVLISRLFPVSVPADHDLALAPQGGLSTDSSGYPSPPESEDGRSKKMEKSKQKRRPMYAIGLVINLPAPQSGSTTASRSVFRTPGSFTDQVPSFPSSYGSARPYGLEPMDANVANDTDASTEMFSQRWDVVKRTLDHLQVHVTTAVLAMLRQSDLGLPDTICPPKPARTLSLSGRRSEETMSAKPPKSNSRLMALAPPDNKQLLREIDGAKTRLVAGLRASRVVTGQNRWPIWREEARWAAKWAGGRDQGLFFFKLLTGFLATHTDWMQTLSPAAYRRSYHQQHHARNEARSEEEYSVPARTVILANDKISARRLIFLLAAFLPASQQLVNVRTQRPNNSSVSGAATSQSPQSLAVPILIEESIRRKINRRTGTRRGAHTRKPSLQSQQVRAGGMPASLAHLSMDDRHEGRVSDTASIRVSSLTISGGDATKRKSSAAATISPETSFPHFATGNRGRALSPTRPGSCSSSLAADDLKRLVRDDGAGGQSMPGTASKQSGIWSNVISSLWTAPWRESIGSRASIRPRGSEPPPPASWVSQDIDSAGISSIDQDRKPLTPRQVPEHMCMGPERPHLPRTARRIPDPTGAFESPIKTSVADDGVIDVDVPFPDFMASLETAVSSPSSSGFLSISGIGLCIGPGPATGLDAFEQLSRAGVDKDRLLNAAGWLPRYHPDFMLQALPANQTNLMDHVKASMRAEPSLACPMSDPAGQGVARWVDVSSALVADASTFCVKRIRYRRLLAPKASLCLSPSLDPNSSPRAHQHLVPEQEVQDEEFMEEAIVALDPCLTEAIEKVIAAGLVPVANDAQPLSVASFVGANGSSERPRRAETGRDEDPSIEPPSRPAALQGPAEVPRSQCKTVILSALEDLVQDVVEKRERGNPASERDSVLKEAIGAWLDSLDPVV